MNTLPCKKAQALKYMQASSSSDQTSSYRDAGTDLQPAGCGSRGNMLDSLIFPLLAGPEVKTCWQLTNDADVHCIQT